MSQPPNKEPQKPTGTVILVAAISVIVFALVAIVSYIVNSEITSGDILSYFGGTAALAGTLYLGIYSYRQTQYANEQAEVANKISQQSLSTAIKANEDAAKANSLSAASNEISLKALAVAEKANKINSDMVEKERLARLWARAPNIDITNIMFSLGGNAGGKIQYFCDGHEHGRSIFQVSICSLVDFPFTIHYLTHESDMKEIHKISCDYLQHRGGVYTGRVTIKPEGKSTIDFFVNDDTCHYLGQTTEKLTFCCSNTQGEYFSIGITYAIPLTVPKRNHNINYEMISKEFEYASSEKQEYTLLPQYN